MANNQKTDKTTTPEPKFCGVRLWPEAGRVDLIKPSVAPLSRGLRGNVTGFSRSSRSNFRKQASTIKPVGCLFITLTYIRPVSWPEASRDLDTFAKRLLRKYPKASGFWRKEIQELRWRRTGDVVIHYHLILYNVRFIKKDWVSSTWGAVTRQYDEEGRPPFTRIERIGSMKKAMAYVNKYCAKLPGEDVPWLGGRAWGKINAKDLPVSKIEEVSAPAYAMWLMKKFAMYSLSQRTGRVYLYDFRTYFRERPDSVYSLIDKVRAKVLDVIAGGNCYWLPPDERNQLLRWAAPAVLGGEGEAVAAWV